MSPYYIFWAILIVASLWVSLGGFLWAHRHGQFKDQERARFLALRGEAAPCSAEKGIGASREACVMLGILAIGACAILAVLTALMLRYIGGTQ